MAGKEKYSQEQIIEAIQATKGQLTLAARHLGCSYETVVRYVNRYPKVNASLVLERDKMGDAVELALYDEAVNQRNIAALIFLAKTKFKNRGYIERQEVTGADGAPNRLEIHYVNRDED